MEEILKEIDMRLSEMRTTVNEERAAEVDFRERGQLNDATIHRVRIEVLNSAITALTSVKMAVITHANK